MTTELSTLEIMKQDMERKRNLAQTVRDSSAVMSQVIDPETTDAGQISEVIGMAWCDKTSFDAIELQTGLTEPQVINIMRTNMKRSSFKMWRKRVTGRKAKHSSLIASN